MAARAASQHTQYSRRRSNTATSMIRTPITPAKIGDVKNFTAWVHEPKENTNVAFNCAYWPGVSEGDVFRVTHVDGKDGQGFFFVLLRDDGIAKPQLQAS